MKFNYLNKTKLVFGEDRVNETVSNIPAGVKKLLLHYGSDRIKKNGIYDMIVAGLNERGIEFVELGGVVANPRLSLVREGIELVKREGVDFILAVGGGSVIDSAKAISAGVSIDFDVWDLFIGKGNMNVEELLPIGVVLTFPATGSEDSTGSVVNNEETVEKRSIGSDYLRPYFSVLDPKLTLSLPDRQTFAGIVDMFSHILERYMENDDRYGCMDTMSEGLMKSIIKSAYILKENPNDMWAREQIMLASTLAHNDILSFGRREDWSSHRIGHELSALYDTIHGESLSIVFPAWMTYVKDVNPARIERLGAEVFGLTNPTADDTIADMRAFFADINMPLYIEDLGLTDADFERMAENATKYGNIGGFKSLGKEDVLKIYRLAYKKN